MHYGWEPALELVCEQLQPPSDQALALPANLNQAGGPSTSLDALIDGIQDDSCAADNPQIEVKAVRRIVCAAVLVNKHIVCGAKYYDQVSRVIWT